MMLKALSLIPDKKIRLICAGRGQELENNKALCRELGLEGRVQFLGYRGDVPDLYGASDAFLFISFREGLSLSLMEAMSSGLPSIVSPIRGNTDLIEDRKEGLYTALNPEAVAQAIQVLASDPALCRKLGDNAKEKVQAFGLDTVAKQMRDIYLSL